ncbi:helix-turn-helix transcriptional regulator [Niveispirillum sp.]|uniref:ArsR/SmtB family transcription factor n=1 Tax=Niveispirillum sp. TaxID=1917217 RepID=UPI001B58A25D|nr:metalloregulator ArsR/SmtB family transcription factor [Niveispirillum sp.]MBP7335402.1 winged helix-turn-helix transcriptional regulator [Niveispirillum sp.]
MDSFTALADPTRRSILEMLGQQPHGAGDIVTRLQQAGAISAPAVSQHLKVLREAGLVRVKVDGQRRIYSLDPAGLDAMDAWIARVRGFWASRLDALEQALLEGEDDE